MEALSRLVSAVREGRGVIDNVRKILLSIPRRLRGRDPGDCVRSPHRPCPWTFARI